MRCSVNLDVVRPDGRTKSKLVSIGDIPMTWAMLMDWMDSNFGDMVEEYGMNVRAKKTH